MNCSGCGLPPLPNKPLKQCSRCKSASYHDVECQKNHYPKHKAECRRLAAAAGKPAKSAATVTATDNSNEAGTFNDDNYNDGLIKPLWDLTYPVSQCQTVEGKGRSLIATSDMHIGARPINPSEDCTIPKDSWHEPLISPLVPPLLMESERIERCAYCFGPTHGQSIEDTNPQLCRPRLLHRHCSRLCRDKDADGRAEENAFQIIRREFPTAEHPSPTVLLCARIIRHSLQTHSVEQKFHELCYDIEKLTQQEKDQYLLIMKNCHSFLRYMSQTDGSSEKARTMYQPDPTPAYKFMSRIIMNGFTISTAEQLGIGIGIYPGASMINHSCRPNALQTFYLFPNHDNVHPNLPMLQITTCQEVKAGEEVTISYCDGAAPTHMRRKELWEGYKFLCDCFWCRDSGANLKVVGLKCPNKSCHGTIIPLQDDNIPSAILTPFEDPKYKCNNSACGYSRFAETLAELSQNVKDIERSMKDDYYGDDFPEDVQNAGYQLNKTYTSLTQICSTQSSWYIAWCADAIVNWSTDAINYYQCQDEWEERNNIIIQALRVIDQSRRAMQACFKYPGNLKWHQIMGIEAKLRLILDPTDRDAFNMLWNAKRYFSLFLVEHDEVMLSFEDDILVYQQNNGCPGSDPLSQNHGHLPDDQAKQLWVLNGCQDWHM